MASNYRDQQYLSPAPQLWSWDEFGNDRIPVLIRYDDYNNRQMYLPFPALLLHIFHITTPPRRFLAKRMRLKAALRPFNDFLLDHPYRPPTICPSTMFISAPCAHALARYSLPKYEFLQFEETLAQYLYI